MGDWSPQPDCYPVELPPREDAVSWKKFNPREQAAILIPDCLLNAGLSLTQSRRRTMPELLGEKARCSLVRVSEIRQSLLGAGVCLAQSTL